MSERTHPLVLDLVEWVAARPRAYAEVMEAWRISCPRLTIWEDALDQGLVAREDQDGVAVVTHAVGACPAGDGGTAARRRHPAHRRHGGVGPMTTPTCPPVDRPRASPAITGRLADMGAGRAARGGLGSGEATQSGSCIIEDEEIRGFPPIRRPWPDTRRAGYIRSSI
jgi:hypothetical protein